MFANGSTAASPSSVSVASPSSVPSSAAAASSRPPARASTFSDDLMHLEVRRCIADTTSEHICVSKNLPLVLPVITDMTNQCDALLHPDKEITLINVQHHHIVRSCECADPAKQQLLLNFFLQECSTRIAKHADEIQRRQEAKRAENPVSGPQSPLLGFICTNWLTKLKLTCLTCVRPHSSIFAYGCCAREGRRPPCCRQEGQEQA